MTANKNCYIVKFFEAGYVSDIYDNRKVKILKNPDFAKKFNSKKSAREWTKENLTFNDNHTSFEKLNNCKKEFDQWIQDGCVIQIKEARNKEFSIKYDKNKHVPEDVLRFYIEEATNNEGIRYEDYTTWPPLCDVFEFIHGINSYEELNNPNTLDIVPVIYVNKNSKFASFKKEVKKTLKYIQKNKDGFYHFDVFDRFLSEGGNSVYFYVNFDSNKAIVEGRYDIKIESNIKECFEYLKKERYYE